MQILTRAFFCISMFLIKKNIYAMDLKVTESKNQYLLTVPLAVGGRV